ncbi:MAG: IPT/TIG domain-containing protein, partial [bacterium]
MRLTPLVLLANLLQAQAPTTPVVTPRGVVNALSVTPAPSSVGPGGLIQITGLNLGPAAGWKAEARPLPLQYGEDPAWQVLVNNRPAGVLEASTSRVLAVVPAETPGGLVNVVVRRGNQQSRAARIAVQPITPALAAANGLGYGVAANAGSDGTMVLSASSLGPEAARAALRVTVGGIPAEAETTASAKLPGTFDVSIQVPEGAESGDLILLGINNAESNSVVMGAARARSELIFVPLAEGSPEMRTLRSSDVDGMNLTVVGARGSDGCYPAYQLNARARTLARIDGCPTAMQAQAATPFVESPGSPEFAALEGPARKELRIFRSLGREPLRVSLPEAVTNVVGQAGGQFVATGAGKNYRVDGSSGEVEEFTPGGTAAGLPGLNPQQLLQRFQNLDLGDGITR